VFFIREHFQRFATNEAKREAPFYFFVLAFIAGFLPYTIAFGAWIAGARVRTRAALRERRDELLLALWFAVIVVFFSLSKSKLLTYILPAFPAAAALAAIAILRGARARGAWLAYAIACTLALGGGLAFAIPKGLLAPYAATPFAVAGVAALIAGAWAAWWLAARDARHAPIAAAAGWGGLYLALILALPRLSNELGTQQLARAAAGVPGARVVAYQNYPQGFAWELRRTIPVVDFTGELATDGARPAGTFWSREDFWRRWRAGEPMAVVLRRRALADWRAQGDSSPVTVASDRTYLVVTNVPIPPAATP
jgi:4-amino-4-deoxy-L-arabinose transferase-like glycosyltransferase